jgi:HSP20 family molecular chaperone IbpA
MANEIEGTVAETGSEVTRTGRQELTRHEQRYALPPVDIYEKQDALTVLADLPGVPPEGLSVDVENGILTIEGKAQPAQAESVLWQEFELTSFYRQFRIAETIDTRAIRATLKNGVLDLTLPKAEKAKPRQIPIEAG